MEIKKEKSNLRNYTEERNLISKKLKAWPKSPAEVYQILAPFFSNPILFFSVQCFIPIMGKQWQWQARKKLLNQKRLHWAKLGSAKLFLWANS